MKKWCSVAAAALWLTAITPAGAIPVDGTFSGVVTGTGGGLVSYPVGTIVTGSYGYDPALLNGNQTSYTDPSVFFLINIGGQMFANYTPQTSGLSFWVDENGIPVFGSAGQSWDLYINGDSLGLSTFGDNYINAQVTYSTPSVPDAGTTSFLMGIALSGLAFTRRFIRCHS
jgi:hypothetical protein